MTTSNNHETLFPKRPVKDWYTLDELARDWSEEFHAEFTRDYLMEQASQPGRILTLGVIAHDWFFYRYDQSKHKDNPHFELLNGFTNLSVHTIKELIFAKSTTVDWIEDCNGGTKCHVCTLGSQKSELLCGRSHQDLIISDGPDMFQPLIHRDDLRISLKERIRYESMILRGQDDSTFDAPPIVDTKEVLVSSPSDAVDFDLSQSIDGKPRSELIDRDAHQPKIGQSISDELAKEDADKKLTRAVAWKLRAKEIAEQLDPKHETQNINVLARQIHQQLNIEDITNRNHKIPSVNTIEREILRGWKAKK